VSRTCAREAEVLAAYRPRGDARRRAGLTAHLAACPACRRTAQLSSALGVLASEGPGFELPDPSRIYWRAQVLGRLAAREEAAEQAARPLVWLQVLAALVAAAIGALAVGTFGLDLAAQALGAGAGGVGRGGVSLLPLAAMAALTLLVAAVWWVWWRRAEDGV